MESHTLSILTEDAPGVLVRVSGLFSRRRFNITSLAVGPTSEPGVSRMTVVVAADILPLEQVVKQLKKLVNVIKVIRLEPDSVQRELLLVKVLINTEVRGRVLETAREFRAKVVDIGPDALVLEVTDTSTVLNNLLRTLEPYGVSETVQSGIVAIGRGRAPLTAAARN